jgi:hypothetical protein
MGITMAVADEPILTDSYLRADLFRPLRDSVYVYERSIEQRSEHLEPWANAEDIDFVEVVAEGEAHADIALSGSPRRVLLRSERQLDGLANDLGPKPVYLDITGLSHHVWAPLLRSLLRVKADVRVVYVEPTKYRFDPAPTEGQIFDLSERIRGLAPLPGFASLASSGEEAAVFIPLLGFEGRRLSYLIEQVQPGNDRIIPIVGVPGFRPEYPFHAYLGNKRPLLETGAWQRARYVPASCPFSIFYLLDRIATENLDGLLRIAPIGTKPHALGAVLFKVVSTYRVELVYDHPIRKPGRTSGSDMLHVYHVSALAPGRK